MPDASGKFAFEAQMAGRSFPISGIIVRQRKTFTSGDSFGIGTVRSRRDFGRCGTLIRAGPLVGLWGFRGVDEA